MKEFNSQVCTNIKQSQRLLALGLKPETADMCYSCRPKHLADTTPEKDWVLQIAKPIGTDIPAWSLHRLIELFTNSVTNESDAYILNTDDAFDAVIDDIEWCINKGYINEEYLK